jgi:hypothetical protein
MTDLLRQQLAAEIREKLEPRLEQDPHHGGYNCCGCATYEEIVNDAVAVVLGSYKAEELDEDGTVPIY